MSSKGNTRPISRSRTSSTNSRGRVYKCLHCDINAYKGEKLRVEQHIYRKHIALDSVPYYCNICKFVTTSQSDLEQHLNIKTYPTHAATVNAMLEAGQCVLENESMLQNIAYYKIGDKDMERLEREESEEIYSARKEKQTKSRTKSQTKAQTNDILRTVMLTSNIPVVTKDLIETLSCATENILPALLGTDVLLSPAPISLTHHSSLVAPVYAPVKINQPTATSSTSSSSSSSSVREREEMRKEIKELREATKTMAQAMDSLITEVNMMRKEITETREEKRAQKEKKEKEKEKEREREERARRKENVERGIQRRREWEQRDHHFHPYRR